MSRIEALRQGYLRRICAEVIFLKDGTKPSMADVSSIQSVEISRSMIQNIGYPLGQEAISGQSAGRYFEAITKDYLEESFGLLKHVRPGKWEFSLQSNISDFDQYNHLADISQLVKQYPELKIALGEYVVKPDIIVSRFPVTDGELNQLTQSNTDALIAPDSPPHHSPLRAANSPNPTLHASVSCKWTIRSDRSQNARTEGLNLTRNRKGHTPHIVVVTGEPAPGRLASLALGTGDIDCVYHFALPELVRAVNEVGDETAQGLLNELVQGRRLRDIADLPFDLAI